jgi:hypothetical protein
MPIYNSMLKELKKENPIPISLTLSDMFQGSELSVKQQKLSVPF